jgi:manganese/zinc/iron transport system substrate-binding protein
MKNLLSLIILVFLVVSCKPNVEQKRTGKLKIVTTTGILADAVMEITGDSAEVTSLMGPGVDPHLYKVSQGDLSVLTKADLIIYNGLHLEGKMGEVLEGLAKQKKVVAIADGISKSELRNVSGFAGGFDPHIWFNVEIWKKGVEYLAEVIQKNDSVNALYYKKNALVYSKRLDSLHKTVISEIQHIPESQRVLVTAHDAFGYFGDAYKIEVKGLQGISTVSEPGLKDISEITKLIVDRKIKAIFVESSVSPKLVESVVAGAKARGHVVKIGGLLYSDALGEKNTPAGTYIGMVNENVKTITSALR